ncbi:hypothetical protein ACYOEI_36730 [Singulisphaera rosea]
MLAIIPCARDRAWPIATTWAELDVTRVRCDDLTAALDLAEGFADLIRKWPHETLTDWLARGEASSNPDLRRFDKGIRRDESAVHAEIREAAIIESAGEPKKRTT